MEFEHEKFGKCVIADITQRQMVAYGKEMVGKGDVSMYEYRDLSIKAAIKHGLIEQPELTEKDVDEASPGLIRWISDKCLTEAIKEANDIDPLSS